jgi:hypothetical protein
MLHVRDRQHRAFRSELRARARRLGTFAFASERLIALSQRHSHCHALGHTSLYFDILEIHARIFYRRRRRWCNRNCHWCSSQCNISFRFDALPRLFVTGGDRNFPVVHRHSQRRFQHRLDVPNRRLRTHFHRRDDVDLTHRPRLTRHNPNFQNTGQRAQLSLRLGQRQHAPSDRRRGRMRRRITRCCEGHGYWLRVVRRTRRGPSGRLRTCPARDEPCALRRIEETRSQYSSQAQQMQGFHRYIP